MFVKSGLQYDYTVLMLAACRATDDCCLQAMQDAVDGGVKQSARLRTAKWGRTQRRPDLTGNLTERAFFSQKILRPQKLPNKLGLGHTKKNWVPIFENTPGCERENRFVDGAFFKMRPLARREQLMPQAGHIEPVYVGWVAELFFKFCVCKRDWGSKCFYVGFLLTKLNVARMCPCRNLHTWASKGQKGANKSKFEARSFLYERTFALIVSCSCQEPRKTSML